MALGSHHECKPLPLIDEPFEPRERLFLGRAGVEGGRLERSVEGRGIQLPEIPYHAAESSGSCEPGQDEKSR